MGSSLGTWRHCKTWRTMASWMMLSTMLETLVATIQQPVVPQFPPSSFGTMLWALIGVAARKLRDSGSLLADLDSAGGGHLAPLLKNFIRCFEDGDLASVASTAQVIQSVGWEKLHTGNWKDVALVWRDVYSLGCLLVACCGVVRLSSSHGALPLSTCSPLAETPSVPAGETHGSAQTLRTGTWEHRHVAYSDDPGDPSRGLPETRRSGEEFDAGQGESEARDMTPGLRSALHELDLGCLMGGPHFRPQIDSAVNLVAAWLGNADAAMTGPLVGPLLTGCSGKSDGSLWKGSGLRARPAKDCEDVNDPSNRSLEASCVGAAEGQQTRGSLRLEQCACEGQGSLGLDECGNSSSKHQHFFNCPLKRRRQSIPCLGFDRSRQNVGELGWPCDSPQKSRKTSALAGARSNSGTASQCGDVSPKDVSPGPAQEEHTTGSTWQSKTELNPGSHLDCSPGRDAHRGAGQTRTALLPVGSLAPPGIRPPRERLPSLECFLMDYMRGGGTGKPVLITGAMEHWPAMERWQDLGYLVRVAGPRTVPIEVGSHYLAEGWGQQLMPLSDFISQHVATTQGDAKSRRYLAQHPLFEQIPVLKEDVREPPYCVLGEMQAVNAWFGPSGTVTPLHTDPYHNLLAQVVGEKYIRLYPPEATSLLHPYEEGLTTNSSQIDVEDPDLSRFPGFADLPFVDVCLKPGEMLYIPPLWWHFVKSLSISFSVSFWWK
eukprot:jgi/Botrbrau1/7371/Bobra.0316s0015.3